MLLRKLFALACAPGAAAADGRGGALAPTTEEEKKRAPEPTPVVVKRGDRGTAVRQVQSALGITADGVFGAQTERAVKRFQARKGLAADGVVGPETRDALGLEPFARGSVRRSASGVKLPRILRLIAE